MVKRNGKIFVVLLVFICAVSMAFFTEYPAQGAFKPKLVKNSCDIVVGGTVVIPIKNISKAAKVTYKSNKAGIVAVSKKGKVTGLRDGSAKVTVIVKRNGKMVKLYYHVTVKAPKLSQNSLSLEEGESVLLEIKDKPKKADIVWKSDHQDVVEVKDGNIIAKAEGMAVVTVQIKTTKKSYTLFLNIAVKKQAGDSSAKVKAILKDSIFYDGNDLEKLAPYYQMAEKRKEEIFNSPTEIVKSDKFIRGKTYTGTAYYVSPNGDDANDGLSPETAWKTIIHVNGAGLEKGDALFFERGGTYRLTKSVFQLQCDVTYSAYGEGAKPVLTRCPENSARVSCWELYHEGENGEKIWRYYKKTGDVGGIVFDDKDYAKRIWEWPAPGGWQLVKMQEMNPADGITAKEDPCALYQLTGTGKYGRPEENLTEDMTYISRVDISNLSYPFDVCSEYRAGELFLRCDRGNPGECFQDIEVIAIQQTEDGEADACLLTASGEVNGYVLDNLSMKYYLDNAVLGSLDQSSDVVIQNCTVEWGGNRLHIINSAEVTNNYCMIGDGIYCVARNAVICNNYMRQSSNACTFETQGSIPDNLGTYTATGNLVENCGQGIRVGLWGQEDTERFDEIKIQDNIILHTGDSMNTACMEEPAAIDLCWENIQYAKHFEVSGNVMVGSTLALMRIPPTSAVKMDIHNNVFAQCSDGILLTECEWVDGNMTWYKMKDILN